MTTAAIELLLFTGCRLGEVLGLRWEGIDFEAGAITLAETKSGRPQTVIMNAPARQVLQQLAAKKGASEWVLPSIAGPKRALSEAGLESRLG